MQSIYNPKFWFSIRPGELSPNILNLFLITILCLVLLTIIFKIVNKYSKKSYYNQFFNSLSALFLTNTIFGALILFFNYELIPFLSSRFWFLIWAVGDIAWVVFIIKKFFAVSDRKLELEKDKEYKKYIPSKK